MMKAGFQDISDLPEATQLRKSQSTDWLPDCSSVPQGLLQLPFFADLIVPALGFHFCSWLRVY